MKMKSSDGWMVINWPISGEYYTTNGNEELIKTRKINKVYRYQ
jgi:hypothetical protein